MAGDRRTVRQVNEELDHVLLPRGIGERELDPLLRGLHAVHPPLLRGHALEGVIGDQLPESVLDVLVHGSRSTVGVGA